MIPDTDNQNAPSPTSPHGAAELRSLVARGRVLCLAGRPIDGDSLASALALRRILINLGSWPTLPAPTSSPRACAFCQTSTSSCSSRIFLRYAAIVILDCGELVDRFYRAARAAHHRQLRRRQP
ncbi:MAG: hypothetical protein U0514_01275 [Candidatus Andersenbacteria bacterium]